MGYYVTLTYEPYVGCADEKKLQELNEALRRGDFPSLQGATVEWDGSDLEIDMPDYLISYDDTEIKRFCKMLSEVITEGFLYITFPEDGRGYVVTPGKVQRTVLVPIPEGIVEHVYRAVEDHIHRGE